MRDSPGTAGQMARSEATARLICSDLAEIGDAGRFQSKRTFVRRAADR
jgi:hypothetical protein